MSNKINWIKEREHDNPLIPTKQPFAYEEDIIFFRRLLYFIGFSLIICILIIGGLEAYNKQASEGLIAITSGLVGAIISPFNKRNH